nr:hypothetical protein [uncultured organism]
MGKEHIETAAEPRIVDAQLNNNRHSDRLHADTVLWRYLDAAKLFDFFENSTLFFCRADHFRDKFEGAFTPTLRDQISASFARGEIDYNYEEFKRRMRESVFINSWHRNQDDSAAMWALYGKSDCAVALTTTVGQLSDTLREADTEHAAWIARVEYVKHWSDPELDISQDYARIFTYKTKAYEYEKEVRVIIDRTPHAHAPGRELLEEGILIRIDPARLLRSIVVAPDAPLWFENLVRQSALRYGIAAPVRRSKLAADPI